MKNNARIWIALLIPIVCLVALAAYKHVKLNTGKTFVIPITGYDPRDLLSGHYLIYRLDIDLQETCSRRVEGREDIYICLSNRPGGRVSGFRIYGPDDEYASACDGIIRGRCRHGRFLAGVERFYVPEKHAQRLDRVVRNGECRLVVKLDRNGNASIQDLLIDGRSWSSYIIKGGSNSL